MKWRANSRRGKIYDISLKYGEWHRWFAWLPVRTTHTVFGDAVKNPMWYTWVWLTFVDRRLEHYETKHSWGWRRYYKQRRNK